MLPSFNWWQIMPHFTTFHWINRATIAIEWILSLTMLLLLVPTIVALNLVRLLYWASTPENLCFPHCISIIMLKMSLWRL
jgi:hypothetical protein